MKSSESDLLVGHMWRRIHMKLTEPSLTGVISAFVRFKRAKCFHGSRQLTVSHQHSAENWTPLLNSSLADHTFTFPVLLASGCYSLDK